MTAKTDSRPVLPGLRLTSDPGDPAWALDRDLRLSAFLTARMREAERTSCSDELRALGWILTVLPAWTAALDSHVTDTFARACLESVGWVLRQAAHSRWSRHPEWEPAFHPQSVAPRDHGEAGA